MRIKKKLDNYIHKNYTGLKYGFYFPLCIDNGKIVFNVGGCCAETEKNKERLKILDKIYKNVKLNKKDKDLYFLYSDEIHDINTLEYSKNFNKEFEFIKNVAVKFNVKIYVTEIYFAFGKVYFSILCEQEKFCDNVLKHLGKIGFAYRAYDNIIVVMNGAIDDNS